MFKTSIAYNDNNVEETIKKIEEMDADFGGTEISAPLLDLVKVEKQMVKYIRHVILITDGQVFNAEEVIKIIGNMKQNNVATVHAVGIGNGVSFDMIRRGAIQGGGEHIFIMDNKNMKKQIIQLLEVITACEIRDFQVHFDQKTFETTFPLIPNVLKKGREASFFLRSKAPLSHEELLHQKVVVSYLDEESQK